MPTTISIEASNAEEYDSYWGGRVPFIITLSEPSVDAVSVSYRTIAGSAATTSDYSYETATVTFAPGETSKSVLIRGNEDRVEEKDEAFVLELYDPKGATFTGNAKVLRETAFILDDDGVGLKRGLFVSSPVLVEGDGGSRQAVFEVSISRPSDTPLSFAYTTKNGTAVAGQDYAGRSGTLTFAAGQTTATVSVPVLGDRAVEASEAFNLVITPTAALADKSAGVVGSATILDDDAGGTLPTISIEASNAEEYDSYWGGRVPFVITLSEAAVDSVTVSYRTIAGTARTTSDYSEAMATVTFAPGETSKTVLIRGDEDRVEEKDEAFTLELYDPAGAVLAGNAKVLRETAFILDDDGVGLKRGLFVSSPVLVEGDAGTQQAVFEISISRASATPISFTYATVAGSAVSGQDFTGRSGTVTFAAGQTTATVSVPVSGDRAVELAEFFSLVVRPTASLGDSGAGAVGIATILDDDAGGALPTISIEASNTEEYDSYWGGRVPFVITLSEASVDSVTVGYRTVAGTAVASSDYSEQTSTVTFAPGETSKTVLIRGNEDRLEERDEAFVLELFDPVGAVFANRARTLRETAFLLDDDGVGLKRSVFLANTEVIEGNEGLREAVFLIEISRPFTTATTLQFATRDGSAIAGKDYVAKSGSVTFAPGQTVAAVRVGILSDRVFEQTETFSLTLTGTIAPTLIAPLGATIGTATIRDTDVADTRPPPAPTFAPVAGNNEITAAERAGGIDITGTAEAGARVAVSFGQTTRTVTAAGDGSWSARFTGPQIPEGGTVNVRATATDAAGNTGAATTRKVVVGFAGDAGANRITGSAGNDLIEGLGGNDVLRGGTGADRIFGGTGFDTIYGDAGNDTVQGNNGRDLIDLGAGNDLFEDNPQPGTVGRDTVTGGSGNDTLRGGGGDDLLRGGLDNDLIYGGRDNDRLYGESGADTLDGGSGNDTIEGGNGRDRVILGIGNDLFTDTGQGGALGRDTVYGGAGNDTIQGNGGDDSLFGGNDADLIYGRVGNDALFGDAGADRLFGGIGNDTIRGGDGADFADLGSGNDVYSDTSRGGVLGQDTVLGGAGNDTIGAGGGNDSLNGGTGADVFVFLRGPGADVVGDFELGVDTLRLSQTIWAGTLTRAQVIDRFADVVAGDAVLDFGGGHRITLTGVTSLSALEGDLFLF